MARRAEQLTQFVAEQLRRYVRSLSTPTQRTCFVYDAQLGRPDAVVALVVAEFLGGRPRVRRLLLTQLPRHRDGRSAGGDVPGVHGRHDGNTRPRRDVDDDTTITDGLESTEHFHFCR